MLNILDKCGQIFYMDTSLRQKGTHLNTCHLEKSGAGRYKLEGSLKIFQQEHIIGIKNWRVLNNSHHVEKFGKYVHYLKENQTIFDFVVLRKYWDRYARLSQMY